MITRGLVWLGTRTPNFDETVRFFRDNLGLQESLEEPDFSVFRLPNGDTVEVFGPGNTEHQHFDAGPVAGFLVEDSRGTRADLEAAGITFLSPVLESDNGSGWSHFRDPDGNVYEITRPSKRD